MHPKPDSRDFKFFVKGKVATVDDVKSSLVTAVLSEADNDVTFHAFDTESELRSWVSTTKYLPDHDRVKNMVEKARPMKGRDQARAQKVQRSRQKWMQQEYEDLARDTGLTRGELFRRATADADLLEGPLLNSAIVMENWDASGRAVLLSTIPWPDFGWFGMDNKASSLWFYGGGVLTENAWYGGRAFWFFGVHFWWPPLQLSFVNFEDIASAGFAL